MRVNPRTSKTHVSLGMNNNNNEDKISHISRYHVCIWPSFVIQGLTLPGLFVQFSSTI
jgi:hypothetical protein